MILKLHVRALSKPTGHLLKTAKSHLGNPYRDYADNRLVAHRLPCRQGPLKLLARDIIPSDFSDFSYLIVQTFGVCFCILVNNLFDVNLLW